MKRTVIITALALTALAFTACTEGAVVSTTHSEAVVAAPADTPVTVTVTVTAHSETVTQDTVVIVDVIPVADALGLIDERDLTVEIGGLEGLEVPVRVDIAERDEPTAVVIHPYDVCAAGVDDCEIDLALAIRAADGSPIDGMFELVAELQGAEGHASIILHATR